MDLCRAGHETFDVRRDIGVVDGFVCFHDRVHLDRHHRRAPGLLDHSRVGAARDEPIRRVADESDPRLLQFATHLEVMQRVGDFNKTRLVPRPIEVEDAALRMVLLQPRQHFEGDRQRVVARVGDQKKGLVGRNLLAPGPQVEDDLFRATGGDKEEELVVNLESRVLAPALASEIFERSNVVAGDGLERRLVDEGRWADGDQTERPRHEDLRSRMVLDVVRLCARPYTLCSIERTRRCCSRSATRKPRCGVCRG
jgi:hypothetical protein